VEEEHSIMTSLRNQRRGITRRGLLGTFGAAGFAAAAPTVFSRAARADPKRLVVYNFDGVLGKFYEDNWIRPFAQSLDVKVDTITMVGSAPPLDKLKAQIDAGRPGVDVAPLQLPQFVLAERNNMMTRIGKTAMPEHVNFYPEYVTDFGPSLVLWSYGLAYNTEKIKTPPTKWRDLWSPEYKGKVALNDALIEQALQMVNLTFTGKLSPVNDDTFKHLTALRPNIVSLWNSGAQGEQLFRTGEVAASPFWNGRVFKLLDEGVPIDFVVPDEGMFVRSNVYMVPRNAANVELATKFLDFIMGEERQKKLAEQLYYGSPNKKVTYTPDVARRVVVASEANMAKAKTEDFAAIADSMADWSRRWNQWKTS